MSIIEKAAQRLEELRKAGVEAPPVTSGQGADARPLPPTPESVAERGAATRQPVHVPDDLVGVAEPHAVHAGKSSTDTSVAEPPAAQASKSSKRTESTRRSKTVEIDLAALAEAGFVTPEAQRSQIADEFRVLKRPIIKNAHGAGGLRVERGNCVMVTSAVPSEGKSFVALNLALSIASEVDSTVLLVDADVANPNILKRLKLPAARGLLDLLTDSSTDVADVLLKTNVEKLSLLPAGSAQRRATEMLASTGMVELVKQLSTRYPDRILVFDSPPLLATTEARVLASHMGQILMVVEADATSQATVLKAVETIESCPVVLMVLNKAMRTDVGGYYGYGFYGATAT